MIIGLATRTFRRSIMGDDIMLRKMRTFSLGVVLLACAIPMTTVAQESAPDGVEITPDVVYGHKDGMALTFDVFRPADAGHPRDSVGRAAILYMVSGGWVSRWSPPESATPRFSALLEKGFTVLAVRHGSSPRYKVPEAEADVRRALRYVHLNADRLGIDADRIGVYGGSAGGHLSLMLGLVSDAGEESADPVLRAPSRVAAVVAYYPPVDLRSMVGPNERFPALEFPAEQAASISPVLHATSDDPPTLLIHGDADELVNISHSVRMQEALDGAGVMSDFITIPGGDHGFRNPEHRASAEALMVDWFAKHLGGS
jgi:acetyl esterase/lipase